DGRDPGQEADAGAGAEERIEPRGAFGRGTRHRRVLQDVEVDLDAPLAAPGARDEQRQRAAFASVEVEGEIARREEGAGGVDDAEARGVQRPACGLARAVQGP